MMCSSNPECYPSYLGLASQDLFVFSINELVKGFIIDRHSLTEFCVSLGFSKLSTPDFVLHHLLNTSFIML